MLLKIGSVGNGLATLGRRKSWKAANPNESFSSYDKDIYEDDLSDARSEDAYIDTYSELLADSAPSWLLAASHYSSNPENDSSSNESILSEELIYDNRTEKFANRLQFFRGKKLDHLRSTDLERSRDASKRRSGPTLFSDSSAHGKSMDIDSMHLSISEANATAVSRSSSFHSMSSTSERRERNSVPPRSQAKNNWAERKHPIPKPPKATSYIEKANETDAVQNAVPPPILFSRDNPPPPPPRRNLSCSQLFPPPPPPRPAPLHDLRNRRLSSGESIKLYPRQLNRSCTESTLSDLRRRRVSFQDSQPSHRPRQTVCTEELSKDHPMRLSASYSGTRQKKIRGGTEVRLNHRPRQLNTSCTSTSFSRPNRSESIQESLSSSMPNVLSDHSSHPKVIRFHDDDDIALFTHSPPSSVAQKNLTARRSDSIQESLSSSMPNVLSDHSSHRKVIRFRDDNDVATFAHPPNSSVESKRSQKNLAHLTKTLDQPDDTHEYAVAEGRSDVSLTTKGKSSNEKSILNKLPLIQKVISSQRDVSEAADKGSRSPPTTSQITKARPKHDKNGRCVKHPSIIVAKKRPFAKGWDIVRDCCPRCSTMSSDSCVGVDELLAPSDRKHDWQLSSSFTSNTSTGSDEIRRIQGVDDFLAASKALQPALSLSDAASRAISHSRVVDYPTKSKRNLPHSAAELDYSIRSDGYLTKSKMNHPNSTTKLDYSIKGAGSTVVSKMPYKTPRGETGWYSGDVDNFGVPNGIGRIRFKSGEQQNGHWSNGYSEQYLDNSNRMKRGFAQNRSPWKEKNSATSVVPSEQPYSEYRSRSFRT